MKASFREFNYDGVSRREEGTDSQDHEMLKLSIYFFFLS